MKKSFLFAPATVIALLLLNSFVIKDKKTTGEAASGVANIVLRSTDGGQTWQDISKGLPEKLQREGIWSNGLFANNHGLYLRTGDGLYHSKSNSTTSFWTKEIFPGKQREIVSGKDRILAYSFRGDFLQKVNGTNDWSPIYTNFQEQAVRIDKTMDYMYKHYKVKEVRSVFETAGGTVFIGSNNMLFRSADNGKSWKPVQVGDGSMKLTELNGVLLSTSKEGILRSTDDGQHWSRVISEGGAGIAAERIEGGFAAIVYNAITQTNTIHISQDDGKTWSVIGEELQPSWFTSFIKQIGFKSSLKVSSIKHVGGYLVCSRPDGIFRSADMGKTWKMILPSEENMGFNLSVSGNVIYAIPNKGC